VRRSGWRSNRSRIAASQRHASPHPGGSSALSSALMRRPPCCNMRTYILNPNGKPAGKFSFQRIGSRFNGRRQSWKFNHLNSHSNRQGDTRPLSSSFRSLIPTSAGTTRSGSKSLLALSAPSNTERASDLRLNAVQVFVRIPPGSVPRGNQQIALSPQPQARSANLAKTRKKGRGASLTA
jgi:hypothetical protein